MLAWRDLVANSGSSQLFEFAKSEITGATTYFVSSEYVKENVPFFECRFSDCSAFKRTRKNHEFIPGGENIVMNCVSGGAFKKLIIQQKDVLSMEHIMPGSLYACFFDEWYCSVSKYISVENYDLNIKFL